MTKKNTTKKTFTLPPIPIGHLTIPQFSELRDEIERITGHKVVLELTDKKTKKKLGTL